MAYLTASKLVLRCALAGTFAAALGACKFDPAALVGGRDATAGDVDGAGQPVDLDAGLDAGPEPDAFEPCWTWTPAHFEPCDLPDPDGALDIPAEETHVYNTDDQGFTGEEAPDDPASAVLTQADGTEAVIISVTDMTVDGELRVEGSRPLIMAASGTVKIGGTVDVSSPLGETTGAGANHAGCPAAVPGEDDGGGGGGGGGGGFQGRGGDGGRGDANDNNFDGTSDGGGGGGAVAEVPATVRGGCPGAPGGQGNSGSPEPGGDGGGAVQITAQTSIILGGDVLAGGSGAGGGPSGNNGGSGGGSGGYIGLDAPSVELESSATLAANGGGGSEGGTRSNTGNEGFDGDASATPASGGRLADYQGGNGGNGGAGADVDGFPATEYRNGGGGGGGGAVGYIILRTADLQDEASIISPAATQQSPQ